MRADVGEGGEPGQWRSLALASLPLAEKLLDGHLVGVSSVCGEGGVGGRAQRGQSPGEARERRHPQTWELGLALGWRR